MLSRDSLQLLESGPWSSGGSLQAGALSLSEDHRGLQLVSPESCVLYHRRPTFSERSCRQSFLNMNVGVFCGGVEIHSFMNINDVSSSGVEIPS